RELVAPRAAESPELPRLRQGGGRGEAPQLVKIRSVRSDSHTTIVRLDGVSMCALLSRIVTASLIRSVPRPRLMFEAALIPVETRRYAVHLKQKTREEVLKDAERASRDGVLGPDYSPFSTAAVTASIQLDGGRVQLRDIEPEPITRVTDLAAGIVYE